MPSEFLASESLEVQTARARLRWRSVGVFVAVILILGTVCFYNRGVRRAYYGVLTAAAALALVVQYSKERALVNNRLLAEAIVTEWGRPVRSRSRVVDALLSRLSGNIPVMKYSFIAFDQKTYTGQTGWGARNLHVGARIPIYITRRIQPRTTRWVDSPFILFICYLLADRCFAIILASVSIRSV